MSKERLVELMKRWAESDGNDVEPCQNCKGGDCILCSCNSLADHLLASGKVIVTPVEVGDTVWYFSENPLNLSVQANTIYEAKVVRIVTTHLGTSLVIQIHNECGCTEIPNITYFGKTVFLTIEEAEAKLKERESV